MPLCVNEPEQNMNVIFSQRTALFPHAGMEPPGTGAAWQ
jgi:hypothetical protein